MLQRLPFNFKKWIEENRHLLKPPVGNAALWKNSDFMVTVVGGPNSRKDYHINPTEEFFYQVEGDIVVKIMDDGVRRDIPIREGEVFLLPPLVPHCPTRGPNTIGLVIEYTRPEGQNDHVRFYCEKCDNILHDPQFYLTDLTTQLQPVFAKFWGDESLRTCKKCGTVMQPPPPPAAKT